MGRKLSLGEKQLMVIARAMLRNPSMVILDKTLLIIDPGTEAIVRRAIKRLRKTKKDNNSTPTNYSKRSQLN